MDRAQREFERANIAAPRRWTWLCEFCYAQVFTATLPPNWDLVFQSAVCGDCQKRVAQDGGYRVVKGGAYAETPDPRAVSENTPTRDAGFEFGGIRFVVDPHVPPGEVQLRQDGRIVARFVAGCDGEIITGSPVTPPDCTLRNPEPPGMTP